MNMPVRCNVNIHVRAPDGLLSNARMEGTRKEFRMTKRRMDEVQTDGVKEGLLKGCLMEGRLLVDRWNRTMV